MTTEVTFRHFDAKKHPTLHDMALEAAEGFTQFNSSILSTHVEFINEPEEKVVEFRVNANGKVLVSSDRTDDFKKSLASAEDKLVRQLKKLKTKTKDHVHEKFEPETDKPEF
jgi:ribosomal subunit interface protein